MYYSIAMSIADGNCGIGVDVPDFNFDNEVGEEYMLGLPEAIMNMYKGLYSTFSWMDRYIW